MKYAAVFYWEQHPEKEGEHCVHVRFPDLITVGLPASTVGSDLADAREAARDILGMMREIVQEKGIVLPLSTPLHKVPLDHGFETVPFKIILENISI